MGLVQKHTAEAQRRLPGGTGPFRWKQPGFFVSGCGSWRSGQVDFICFFGSARHLGILGGAVLMFFLSGLHAQAGGKGKVIIHGQTFFAEVARTPQERTRGLMFREALPGDQCMFFIYDRDGKHPIWMKNCKIALDTIWTDEAGNIVEIQERIPPCPPETGETDCPTCGGNVVSRYFVECAAGTVARAGVKLGDRLSWDLQVTGEGRWINPPSRTAQPVFIPE